VGFDSVNFVCVVYSAARALDLLNFTPMNNKSIRVMYSHRDPSSRKSGTANIFIKVHFLSLILVGFMVDYEYKSHWSL